MPKIQLDPVDRMIIRVTYILIYRIYLYYFILMFMGIMGLLQVIAHCGNPYNKPASITDIKRAWPNGSVELMEL